jgi:hypothetical protein
MTAGGPPHPLPELAAAAGLSGWNLRCNRCGRWGADWVDGQRPGWGALALCDPHAVELADELRRHERALAELRRVVFEQPTPAVTSSSLVRITVDGEQVPVVVRRGQVWERTSLDTVERFEVLWVRGGQAQCRRTGANARTTTRMVSGFRRYRLIRDVAQP